MVMAGCCMLLLPFPFPRRLGLLQTAHERSQGTQRGQI
jgi:hypothetical protein